MKYPIEPEQWMHTPILRRINPLTELIEGDDSGYRKMRTLPENDSPLVVPDVLICAYYDGMDEYGNYDPSIELDGGLPDGALVVRKNVARELEDADRVLQKLFGGTLKICALDGFRSWRRQAAGFTRLLKHHMERRQLTDADLTDRVHEFMDCGNAADGTMSWVNADTTSLAYETLVKELRSDARFMEQLRDYTVSKNEAEDDALFAYITISANSGIGRAANRNISLVFECNAHAGGGAVDLFLVDGRDCMPINIVPFDYPGMEAGMDYMEEDAHFDKFLKHVEEEPLLKQHLDRLGYTTAKFQLSDWNYFRDVNRVRYHLGMAKGWTYYSSHSGGENWHWEPGNIGYDAWTGEVLHAENLTAAEHPDSGNPGHALQKHGRDAIAVWGGASGHKMAENLGLQI